MGVETPMLASQPAITPTPESIRQRQLDRLSPRGRFAKGNRIDALIQNIQDESDTLAKASQAPAVKSARRLSPDTGNARRPQGIMRREKNAASRTAEAGGDARIDVTSDGCSASREGRQFRVANVGNNGRIYLR